MPEIETLPASRDLGGRDGGAPPVPFLFVILNAARPLAPPMRVCLSGAGSVLLGRGDAPSIERPSVPGGEVVVRVADPWMSSSHVRILRAFGKWVATDAGSRNGTTVDGEPLREASLATGALLEAGRTFFTVREDPLPASVAADALAPFEPAPGLATMLPAFGAELAFVPTLATSPLPVLVRAESGAGKELVARALHTLSGRSGPFVPVNCGAIPQGLVEAELFGHRRGAFTGATEDRAGVFRSAHQGTLFLDELGDLPLASQAAFLRVLQEREVRPVGAAHAVPVDVRVVAATHRPLEEMAERGEFRADLLARVAGYTLALPALRDRREDTGLVLAALLRRIAEARADDASFTMAAARALLRYDWPLNVRELEHALQAALLRAGRAAIDTEHLPPALLARATARASQRPPRASAAPLDPEDAERRATLVSLLREHGGNVSAVARAMGKARMQVQRWMKRYAIEPQEYAGRGV